MNKDLLVTEKNSKLLLAKSKSLIDITNKILNLKNNNCDGDTWIDANSNLMWRLEKVNDERLKTWEDTFEYAKTLNKIKHLGYDDWKIPTIDELKTILLKDKSNNRLKYGADSHIATELISCIYIPWQLYWSSTKVETDSSLIKCIEFRKGEIKHQKYTRACNVLYVRKNKIEIKRNEMESILNTKDVKLAEVVKKINDGDYGCFYAIHEDLGVYIDNVELEDNKLNCMAYAYARRFSIAGLYAQGIVGDDDYEHMRLVFQGLQHKTGQTKEFQIEANIRAQELILSYDSRFNEVFVSNIVNAVNNKQIPCCFNDNKWYEYEDLLDMLKMKFNI